MFRKLYWVTEQIDRDGFSRVTGVFTSIPNLVKEGLACNDSGRMRLTLTKLDSVTGPLATWNGPDFAGLDSKLQELIKTDDFSPEQCQVLLGELTKKKAGV
jgi:hypothetical protein